MVSIPITALFIGVFVLLQIPLTVMVGYRRARTGIQFFDGGDQTLLRRMRAHGNYTETVPIVLSRPCKTPQTRMNTSFFGIFGAPNPPRNVMCRATF
jgi:hypothetical protein